MEGFFACGHETPSPSDGGAMKIRAPKPETSLPTLIAL
jgi:hypothetical protein